MNPESDFSINATGFMNKSLGLKRDQKEELEWAGRTYSFLYPSTEVAATEPRFTSHATIFVFHTIPKYLTGRLVMPNDRTLTPEGQPGTWEELQDRLGGLNLDSDSILEFAVESLETVSTWLN